MPGKQDRRNEKVNKEREEKLLKQDRNAIAMVHTIDIAARSSSSSLSSTPNDDDDDDVLVLC